MADEDDFEPPPAHRPSRRSDIVDAAVRQFASKGFVDTAISDVAEDADLGVAGIYYHFSDKEKLFDAAVNHVFKSISDVVAATREEQSGRASSLDAVIDAVWSWIDDQPEEASLLYLQLPGATRQITTLRHELEDQHVQLAFRYLGDESSPRQTAARRGIEALTVRTLIDVLISVHTMRLSEGPLSGEPGYKLRAAVRDLAKRLVRA